MAAVQSRSGKAVLSLVMLALMLALPVAVFAQDNGPGLLGVFMGGVWLFLCLGVFILDVVILLWVYQDANKRGANGMLWALIVFFGSLLGLLLYFAIGRNPNRMV